MMVLQGRRSTDSADVIFPADRCTWVIEQEPGTSNYRIADGTARFYPGTAAAGVEITGTPLLGTIGKTGRFVGFTV